MQVVVLSALTGQRTEKLLACVDRAAKQFQRRVSTSVLNEVIKDATMWMTPPTITGRMGRVYYAIQVSTRPPTIVLFVNDPDLFPESYRRFMEKKIRESFGFEGTPIRLIWRGKTLRQINRSAKHGELGRIVGEAMKR